MKIITASVLATIISASTYVQGFALSSSLHPLATRSLDQEYHESGATAAFDISNRSDGDLHVFEKRAKEGGHASRGGRKKKYESSEDSGGNHGRSMRERTRHTSSRKKPSRPQTKRRKKYETESESESESESSSSSEESSEEEQDTSRGSRRARREREAARRAEIREGKKKAPPRSRSEEDYRLSRQAEKLALRTEAKSPKDSSPEPADIESLGYMVTNYHEGMPGFEVAGVGPSAARRLKKDLKIDFTSRSWYETKINAGRKGDAIGAFTDAASGTFMMGSKYQEDNPLGAPIKVLSHQAMLHGLKQSNAYLAKRNRKFKPTQPNDMLTYGEVGVVNGASVAKIKARRAKDGIPENIGARYSSDHKHFREMAESDNGRAEFGMLRSHAKSQGLKIDSLTTYDFGEILGIMMFWHLKPAKK